MKKKVRNILLWILSWVVLFVVLAYSPIGSPGLYHQNQSGNNGSNPESSSFKILK